MFQNFPSWAAVEHVELRAGYKQPLEQEWELIMWLLFQCIQFIKFIQTFSMWKIEGKIEYKSEMKLKPVLKLYFLIYIYVVCVIIWKSFILLQGKIIWYSLFPVMFILRYLGLNLLW